MKTEMSKEMTPKEAIERIIENLPTYKGFLDDITVVKQVLTELEELKRYPTSKEVCLSIMKHYDSKIVFYNEMAKTFNEVHLTRNEEVVSNYANGEVGINYNALPPHLITLIGRFYEGIGEE